MRRRNTSDALNPLWPVLFPSPSERWLMCVWSRRAAGVYGVLHGSAKQTREVKEGASVLTHVWCSSPRVVWWFRFSNVKIMKCAVNQGLQAAYWNMHDFAIISNPLSYTNPYFMLNIKVGWFLCDACWISRFVVTKSFNSKSNMADIKHTLSSYKLIFFPICA